MASRSASAPAPAYGGKPLLPLGTLSPLFVSNYASTQVRGAGPPARRRRGSDVWRPGLQHTHLAAPDRMNALNITTDDVAQALREQNVQGAAGRWAPPVFNGQQQTLTIKGWGV